MDGGKCVLQLRGVRAFLSAKYDLTQHPNYKNTADFDQKYLLDIEEFFSTRKDCMVKNTKIWYYVADKSEAGEVIMVNEFNEYVRDSLSAAGDIVIRSMMGGYLVYFNGKLIGDICDKELFLKKTPTTDRLLADSEQRYPYEGSKTLMYVFDGFEDAYLIAQLLDGMYTELPEKKRKKDK